MSEPKINYILTDIEGTTSDIRYVQEASFPYATEHLPSFIQARSEEPEVAEQLTATAVELGCDPLDLTQITAGLLSWIEADLKKTPLKALQGQVWRAGYLEGDFTGHVYEDAHRNLTAWSSTGLGLGVYSSGSVEAQRLLFGHSDFGDLTPLFSDYFDTKVGHKREVSAYQNILGRLIEQGRVQSAGQVLFLSDVLEELDAAHGAGIRTAELRRDHAQSDGMHPVFHDFDQLSALL